MFDFSDATNRKVASAFLQELMRKPLEHEDDDEGNVIVIGDGLNFGGDNDWAEATARLARKIHAAPGEFEEVVLAIIEELAQPCRERTADCVQWIHSLSLTGLLLKNVMTFRYFQGKAIELLQSLLLPGVTKLLHIFVCVSFLCMFLSFFFLINYPFGLEKLGHWRSPFSFNHSFLLWFLTDE